MASITLTRGNTLPDSSAKSDFHNLVDQASASITNIVNADVSNSAAIGASKLDLSTIAQNIAMSSKVINYAKGSDIASATTTDIGASTGNFIDVTGTTTITGLGTVQAGTIRFVRFTGILTLTHNGTSLLLPSAANITTAANDVAGFVSLGSGNWKCLWYQRYSGAALVNTVTSPFSTSYTSTAQTITAAGALSLTHSLGSTPSLVQCRLKCISTEGGYSANDEVVVNPGLNWYGNGSSANVGGTSLVVTSTTVEVRFGATSGSFFIVNKTDGTNFQIDNTKWQLIVRAWV